MTMRKICNHYLSVCFLQIFGQKLRISLKCVLLLLKLCQFKNIFSGSTSSTSMNCKHIIFLYPNVFKTKYIIDKFTCEVKKISIIITSENLLKRFWLQHRRWNNIAGYNLHLDSKQHILYDPLIIII